MNKTSLIFLLVVSSVTFVSYKAMIIIDDKINPLPVYGDENHTIPSFEFINQKNEIFNSEEHKNKVWIINYFFTSCPSVCPKMMKTMQEVHDKVRNSEEVILLSFTVDPKRDKPERFMNYLERFNLNHDNWQLLTGNKRDLYRLARRSFLISATEAGAEAELDFIHSENIVTIDKVGKIRCITNGTAPNADNEIIKVISRLLNES